MNAFVRLFRFLSLTALAAAGLLSACTPEEITQGGQTTQTGTGTIGGRVTVAGTSAGLAGATVTTQPATSSATSDASGNYTISSVPVATYTVTAARTGYTSGTMTAVTVFPGATSNVNLALTAQVTTGTISGKVTQSGGTTPLSGVAVTTLPATTTAMTNAQGDYTISSVSPGSYTVSAALSGYATGTASATVTAGQTATANISLSGSFNGYWSGTTSQGQDIIFTVASNAVTVFYVGYQASGSCSVTGTSKTTFTTPLAISGNALTINQTGTPPVSVSYSVTGTFTSPTAASGTASFTFAQTIPGATCNATGAGTWTATAGTLPSTGTLKGRIIDASNFAGIAGATVGTQPATTTTTTDGSGNYTLAVPPGSYTITASGTGYVTGSTSGSTTVTAGFPSSVSTLQLARSYSGTWTGTTTQGKPITFTVVNNAITSLTFDWAVSVGCTASGTTSVTFTTPVPISGSSFSTSGSGTPPSSLSWTFTGVFSSATAIGGSLIFTLTQSSPNPACTGSANTSYSATR